MFDVQVISASLSQKPMVSPYQRGTSAPRRGTAPSIRNSRPDMDVGDEVVRHAGHDLHQRRRHDDRLCSRTAKACQRRMKPFGPAILGRPLRGVGVALVVGVLHHALLVFRRQQRQHGRQLHVPHAVPVLDVRQAGLHYRPFQSPGSCGVGVLRGPAALLRLGSSAS